jgi:hypothetical protein
MREGHFRSRRYYVKEESCWASRLVAAGID